jgi:pimeloyl-ACP methyl ester carboxylesterase
MLYCLRLFSAIVLIVLGTVIILAGCSIRAPSGLQLVSQPGQVVEYGDVFGTYYAYVPKVAPGKAGILVLVHGTPQKQDSAEFTAHYYITNWVDFAEQQGLILIVPAFNQRDFSSRLGDHAMSGYRGLFGRQIGADEWILRLVDAYQAANGTSGTPFYLYGHSAGGQFVARFLVTHPERIERAVLSAAATYPQITTQVAWPYGMGELHAEIAWDAETTRRVDIVPDKNNWLAATQVPLTVIVGLNDVAEVPYYPGQQGVNRLLRARNWVRDMGALADENGLKSRFTIEMIPGKGHSMYGLIPYVQEALVPR